MERTTKITNNRVAIIAGFLILFLASLLAPAVYADCCSHIGAQGGLTISTCTYALTSNYAMTTDGVETYSCIATETATTNVYKLNVSGTNVTLTITAGTAGTTTLRLAQLQISGSGAKTVIGANAKIDLTVPTEYVTDGEADGWSSNYSTGLNTAGTPTATASGRRARVFMRGTAADCNDAAYSEANSCYSYSQAWYYGYGQGMGYWSYGYGYSQCFPKDTEILMADGTTRRNQDIRPGDRILSYDLQTNQKVASTVQDLVIHEVSSGYLIFNNTIRINAGYPTWVVNNQTWLPAREVKPGDTLLDPDNKPVKVSSIDRVEGAYTGFHLTLEEENPGNFFAGGVLVHPR